MKTPDTRMKVKALALAVEGLLAALYVLPAHSDDEQAASLKLPANFIEFGALNVSRDSFKFGEYTGLRDSGPYAIGNFSIRGGDAYGDGNGTRRWTLTGTDVGLTSRTIGATIGDQGRWNFGIGYDELRHYTSDSYQTPYLGSMGGNSFVLPAGFGLAPNTRTLSTAQLNSFQNMDISNKRENKSLTGGYILNSQWSIKVDYNRLDQSGAKLQGFGSSTVGGAAGERVSILPMPTDFKTDTVNAALNWIGDKGFATASYFGSFFHDNNNGVTFQTFATARATQTMGTPPDNDFHQLNLTGGYALSARTKLAGGLSYSRNTQNDGYAYDNIIPTVMVTASPTTSLDGVVVNTHADAKLTDQTTKDLVLSAAMKYDDRDNRTASHIYNFNAISGANTANYPNAPRSVKKWQVELAGDYRVDSKQKIRLALSHDDTHRECDQYAVGGGTPAYAPGTDCVTVPNTREDKVSATYRLRASDAVNVNAAYGYSDRKSDRDLNARPPMIGLDGNPTALSIASTATGGITGLNGGEFRGFNPFFEASRTENMLKLGGSWQASDPLSVGASARYTDDNYNTTYGLQKGHAWSLNFDTTYNYWENGVVNAFVTWQERTRDMTNVQRSPLSAPTATIPSGGSWNNDLKDTDTTVGLAVKQGGLMGGKLDLGSEVTYTMAKTSYNTTLNYALLSGPPCNDPSIYTCVALPDIQSKMIEFKLNGTYTLNKNSKLASGYQYRHLHSEDFYYNGLQTGFTPTSVLPTNQTAPSYSVNVVWLSYIYTFQ